MAEEPTHDISSGADLSAALRLGFFVRYVNQSVLEEVLVTLRKHVAPDAYTRMRQAAGVLAKSRRSRSDIKEWLESLVAAADSALPATHPCRILYDVGAAIGNYCLQRLADVDSPDTSRLWDRVQLLPDFLTRYAGCLHELAREASGDQDLEAVVRRSMEPWADLVDTDDKAKQQAAWDEFVSHLTPYCRERLQVHARFGSVETLVEFISELSKELAEVRSGSTDRPQQEFVDSAEGTIDNPGNKPARRRGWRQGYLGLQFDEDRHVVRREGIEKVVELSPLNWHLLQILDSFEDRPASREALEIAWSRADLAPPSDKRIDDALTDLRKLIEPLGLGIDVSRKVGWTLIPATKKTRKNTRKKKRQ